MRLAGGYGGEGNGVMLRMRRGDVDHIHAVIGHDLGVCPHAGEAVLSGEGLRALNGAAGYRHRLGTRDVRKVLDHQGRDATRSDDPQRTVCESVIRAARRCFMLPAIEEMKIGMKISHQ